MVVSNTSCIASGAPAPPVLKPVQVVPGGVFWEVTGPISTPPLPADSIYTLSCNLTVTNTASVAAWYMPAAFVRGARTTTSVSDGGSATLNPGNSPTDPLGVSFAVTDLGPNPLKAQLDTRFSRSMSFAPVNERCDGSIRITVVGPLGSGPVELSVDGEPPFQVNVGVFQSDEAENGTFHVVITPPSGMVVTPTTAEVTISCGQLSELNITLDFDTDGDGIGDNTDTDDDNDGFADAADGCPLTPGTVNGCTPVEVFDHLEAQVTGLPLPAGADQMLSATLAAANAAMDRGNPRPAQALLRAFILQVRALERRGVLSASEASDVIAQAQALATGL